MQDTGPRLIQKLGPSRPEDSPIFRTAEAAILLEVTPRTVRNLASRGKLRYVVVRERRYFPLSAIRQALREREGLVEGLN